MDYYYMYYIYNIITFYNFLFRFIILVFLHKVFKFDIFRLRISCIGQNFRLVYIISIRRPKRSFGSDNGVCLLNSGNFLGKVLT